MSGVIAVHLEVVASNAAFHLLPSGESSHCPIVAITTTEGQFVSSSHIGKPVRPLHVLLVAFSIVNTSKFPMQHSRHGAGPGFFQGSAYVNAGGGVFNEVGRDQYNTYSNAVNDDIVVRRSFHRINSIIVEFGTW